MPMRTDNEIKNYWNSYLRKHYEKKDVDPFSPKTNSTDSSTESKSNDLCMVPSKKTDSDGSKSISSSTQLLNKVASKILASGYLEAIKSRQPVVVAMNSNNSESVVKSGIGLEKENGITEPVVPHLTSSSSHSSTSVKLLNKMATSLPHKVLGLEAAKAVFSKLVESNEKVEHSTSDGSFIGSDDPVGGGCLNALSPFEYDGPHITKIIDSPSSSPTLIFNQETTPPSCFSDNNEDSWQCVSSTCVAFRNYAPSGGDFSVSEINLGESSSSSCFLFENADLGTCDDEITKYIQYL